MSNQTRYMTIVEPVLEVTLIGRGDAAPWRQPLAVEGIALPLEQNKIEIILSAVEARYLGVKFREFSISLRIDETRVFLVYAFNSNRLFAMLERAFFRTPYYYAKLAVSPHNIRLIDQEQRLFEAALPATAPVTHSQDECNEWQIWLPAALRKQPHQPHYFNARLEGSTRHYEITTDKPVIFTGTGLPAPIQPLRESGYVIEDWLVRDSAKHSKSQTFTRA
ncbi:MAG: hypothetical protein H7X77_07760 [Anaerolineae bacterium]|nr:hypothetical protein [Anaerolineae bacterium]